ncbi:hypothetical protein EV401DRAFT_1862789, partial [Pisolithus croceorrhizus]
ITSRVPEDVEAEFESLSMKYRPRDQILILRSPTLPSFVRNLDLPLALHC